MKISVSIDPQGDLNLFCRFYLQSPFKAQWQLEYGHNWTFLASLSFEQLRHCYRKCSFWNEDMSLDDLGSVGCHHGDDSLLTLRWLNKLSDDVSLISGDVGCHFDTTVVHGRWTKALHNGSLLLLSVDYGQHNSHSWHTYMLILRLNQFSVLCTCKFVCPGSECLFYIFPDY